MKDVGQGEPLTPQSLKLEQWPKDKVPPGSMNHLEDIENRRTRTKLYAGEPILDAKLAPKGVNAPGADIMIPKGYRVVSIRVDAVSGGGNLLLPGCRVDILVHMAKNPSMGIRETTTRTILQDIKVFAVNDVVGVEPGGPETKSIQARTVSLLVTPAQAEKVTLAQEMGNIKLVMRSPEEDTQAATEGARPQELFGVSEKGERKKEQLDPDGTVEGVKEKGKGFLDFLKAVQQKAEAEKAAAPPAEELWSMRVLSGPEINDVTLRGAISSGTTEGGCGGWRTRSPGAGSRKGRRPPRRHCPIS